MQKDKLSKEEIARVFAMYLGCKVQYFDFFTNQYEESIFTGNADTNFIWVKDTQNGEVIDQARLLLTPISAITDEDAIEVAKILKVSYSNDIDSDAHFDITGLAYYLKELFEPNGNVREMASDCILNVIDYLRSKGYALPYKGQNLFELGIALPSTSINNLKQ